LYSRSLRRNSRGILTIQEPSTVSVELHSSSMLLSHIARLVISGFGSTACLRKQNPSFKDSDRNVRFLNRSESIEKFHPLLRDEFCYVKPRLLGLVMEPEEMWFARPSRSSMVWSAVSSAVSRRSLVNPSNTGCILSLK
jgi:hypothetical protein